MKKATILLAAAMTGMLFGPAAAATQNPDPQTDTTAIEVVKESSSSTPASDMVLRSDNKSGSLALEIAGYQIMLSSPDRNDQKSPHAARSNGRSAPDTWNSDSTPS